MISTRKEKMSLAWMAVCGFALLAALIPLRGADAAATAGSGAMVTKGDVAAAMAEGVPLARHQMMMRKLWQSDPIFQMSDNLDNYQGGDGPVAMPAPKRMADVVTVKPTQAPVVMLSDIATLTGKSDFSAFVGSNVPVETQRAALRKLWRSDPAFARNDGLDNYLGDGVTQTNPRLAQNDAPLR